MPTFEPQVSFEVLFCSFCASSNRRSLGMTGPWCSEQPSSLKHCCFPWPSSPGTWPASMPFPGALFLLSQAQRGALLAPLPQHSFLHERRLSLETGSQLSSVVSAFHLAEACEGRNERAWQTQTQKGKGRRTKETAFNVFIYGLSYSCPAIIFWIVFLYLEKFSRYESTSHC